MAILALHLAMKSTLSETPTSAKRHVKILAIQPGLSVCPLHHCQKVMWATPGGEKGPHVDQQRKETFSGENVMVTSAAW